MLILTIGPEISILDLDFNHDLTQIYCAPDITVYFCSVICYYLSDFKTARHSVFCYLIDHAD